MIKIKYCFFVLFILFSIFILTSRVFASTEVSSDITIDTTWTVDDSPYVVYNSILVDTNVTLTINPGVVIKFDSGASLIVAGAIKALGTAEQPIYFTSIYDDSVGGDVDGDEGGNDPASSGKWSNIMIISITDSDNKNESILNYVFDKYSNGEFFIQDVFLVSSDNFNSDQGIIGENTKAIFTNLSVPSIEIYNKSIFTIKNSTINNTETGKSTIDIFNNSNMSLDNVVVNGSSSYSNTIGVYVNSSLEMKNSSVPVSYNGLEVYSNSSALISNSSFTCEEDCISIYASSSIVFGDSSVSCGDDCMLFFGNGKGTIENTKISGASDAGVIIFANDEENEVSVTKSEIFENNYGVLTWGSPVLFSQNSIYNNMIGAETFPTTDPETNELIYRDLDFKNNWWGDESGPYNSTTNPEGFGDEVSDNILYTPWLISNPLFTCCSNVLFLPGLEASRLYKQKTILGLSVEDQLWEPNINADVEDLYLNSNGTSINPDIYTKDIIKETNTPVSMGPLGQNIYKSFSNMMDDLVSEDKIIEWKSYAYDWRQDINDIVNNGTKYQDGNISLISTLQTLVDSSKSGKVTIIAHSNGGLLAKALLKKLQDDKIAGVNSLIDNVDVLILVGVPEIGTAVAVPAILHGYDQRILGGLLMNKVHARELGRNMISAYGLLPSREYINRVSASPATFVDNLIPSGVTTKLVQTFGSAINSYDEYKDFLLGNEGRINPEIDQINLPISLSESLFSKAESLHNNIDAFTPPTSLRVIEVAGWGLDTVASFEYYPKYSCDIESFSIGCGYTLDERPRFTSDGDKTVIVPSAQYMSFLGSTEKYWLDLNKYNLFRPGILGFDHKDILEVNQLSNLIKSTIKKEDIVLDTVLKNTQPTDDSNRLRLSIHSPVTFDAYDANGNHTGKVCPPDYDFCYVEENILNSSYLEFGEGKYINLPEDQMSKIKLQGTDIGTFTYESEKILPDGTSTTSSFVDIPVTTQTQVEIVLNSITQEPELKLDVTGDGITDFSITSKKEFDPIFFLQVMKKNVESFDISKQQKNMLLKRIDDTIKAIEKGKINKAKLKIEQFKKSLIIHPKEDKKNREEREKKNEQEHEKEHKENKKPKQLNPVDVQALITMLNKLLDNLN